MNNKENLNLGDELKDIVQDALNNKNFSDLNKNIGNVVKEALYEAKNSVDWQSRSQSDWNKTWNSKNQSNKVDQTEPERVTIRPNRKPVNDNRNLTLRRSNYAVPVGQFTGIALTALGTLGSIGFGVGITVLSILGFTIGSLFNTISIFLIPLFLFSLFVLFSGNSIRNRLKRFQKYMLCLKDKDYCEIDELAALSGFTNKFVEKDLQKMINVGMFPQGHLDNKKTTFILTNELYKRYLEVQYLETKKNIAKKNLQGEGEKFLSASEKYDLKKEENEKITPEMRKTLNEGRRFITEIKQANILIPGQEISRKLDQLEVVVGKIFDYVEIHPEKFGEIKKFTEYFLPTTYKLVDAYKKMDNQSIQGENILSAKKEIEDTMDTINLAFENLLDDLFHDISMDISTDISVLETMLAQEGLTQNDMRIKNNFMEDDDNE